MSVEYRMIGKHLLVPDVAQPRRQFCPDAIRRLSESMKAQGVLQPLRVRFDPQREVFPIICGESRYRGSLLLPEMLELPCIVVEGEPSEAVILADQLVENNVRSDLKPLDQARAYARLKTLRGLSASALAKELGISSASWTRAESLLTLPEDVQLLVDAGELAEDTAYQISRLPDAESQRKLALAVVENKLSRAKATAEVNEAIAKPARTKPSRVACRFDDLTIAITAKSLSWDAVKAAIQKLAKEADRLQKAGKDVNALGQPTVPEAPKEIVATQPV